MRLFLTDYHLEMARLLLAEMGITPPEADIYQRYDEDTAPVTSQAELPAGEGLDLAREHARQAAQLVADTGYNRRLPELRALQTILGLKPSP